MAITRRRLLGTGIVSLAGGLALRHAWAATEIPLAGGRLLSLSDGHLVLPEALVLDGLPTEEARTLLAAAGQSGPELRMPCNITLWQGNGATVLFDAGAGADFMTTTGHLPDALAAAGVDPSAITHVVFTHGHPDHLWGVLDEFDEPRFPAARHLMGRAERDFWSDPATIDRIGADRQSFAAGALRRIGILGDMLETFEAGDSLLPGVVALATPGHTPGHMSFRLGEEEDALIVLGDAVPNAAIALARPDWHLPSDQDRALAAATRSALLADLAAPGRMVIGFHFPQGGIGRITESGEGYTFVPAG
ncbi:Zn-dependent hydrolase, including glyoxylase [Rubellimicrobium thermophilum DSM 16684]|uniref:Zn-dependent hydrolase, including glyoxylase n=1 Tax=Rubellimicrobium thermophilum DSM 16684 TaxID=1123069 RepID=S9QTY1_9RHOB|nr:MBL fold metallo-hydrolase [Rubellimicrobium thermophilum]EPX84841.1 Zn-dependent hydrolase, including glyoxylase [Rubellimicrobium thermophilum DSM 16684]